MTRWIEMTCLLCTTMFWALFLQFSIHLLRTTSPSITSFLGPWIRGYFDNAMSEALGAACPYRRETSTTLSRFVPYISLMSYRSEDYATLYLS